MKHYFSAFQVKLDGSLANRANLSHDELGEWMHQAYGKFATVRVERNDGSTVIYTDNGEEFVPIKKIKKK